MTQNLIKVALILVLFTSCNDEPGPTTDTNAPVITLNGANEIYLSLGSTYTEEGATANDSQDGDISSSIVITGSVNPNLKGEYHKYYNVSDNSGNNAAQATRYIHVVNDADFMIGNYIATPDCGATPTNEYSVDVTTSNTVNNEIHFTRVIMGSPGGGLVKGVVNGTNILIPNQVVNTLTYEGTGVINGQNFSLDATVSHDNYDCHIEHVKQ